jgi:hypothetical protein
MDTEQINTVTEEVVTPVAESVEETLVEVELNAPAPESIVVED